MRTTPATAAPCASSRSRQDVARRIEAKQREQYQAAALEQAKAEAEAAAEQKVLPPRARPCWPPRPAMTAKLADFQARLAQAEQAKAAARSRSRR